MCNVLVTCITRGPFSSFYFIFSYYEMIHTAKKYPDVHIEKARKRDTIKNNEIAKKKWLKGNCAFTKSQLQKLTRLIKAHEHRKKEQLRP